MVFANTANSQLFINEFMAANSSAVEDPDFSNSADWIELFNSSDSEIDLSGYYLTDNLSDTTKWMIPLGTLIPANGFLIFWADGANLGNHTSFSLSSIGEELGLYSADSLLLDNLIFDAQETDISYGRETDGSAQWMWFSESTPGTSNNTSTPYIGITYYQPFYSVTGGFFSSPQSVDLYSLGGTIHYTLDGRTPTLADPIYENPIAFDTTTFIRAKVFQDGFIPGPTITHSYFFDGSLEQRGLPVVSLVADPDFFWDADTGIYVQDFKPEWEHPLNIELFENDGNNQSVFNLQAGVKVNGLWSWQLPQKMLGIYFRNEYGSGHLDYPLFHDRDRDVFDEFMLRASGSDWSYTLFRDGLCQSLTQENGPVHNQGFRPSIVFINGEYLGIHNMRSRSNGEDLEQTYGVPSGTYDIINNHGEIEEGSDVQFQHLDSLFNSDLSVADNYLALSEVMDITNFTDYWITEIWSSNSSWGHNVKLWKSHDIGKWQFLFGDLDRGFVGSDDNGLDDFSIPQGNDYDYGRIWLQHMFENDEYAIYFAQRFNDHLYTTYHPTRVNEIIDVFSSRLVPEIPYHVERWTGTTSNYGDGIVTVEFWENEVLALQQFAESRQGYMMGDLMSKFNLDQFVTLGTASLPNEGGKIKINQLNIPKSPWSGPYFMNLPFELSAIPNPGYNFEGWSEYVVTSVFDLGQNWKYNDDGVDLNTEWSQLGYDASSWSSGIGEFGYGDGDEATLVSFGPDGGNKFITTYFRKEFNYSGDDSNPVSCILNIRRDDGVVVYHNGVEVLRSNMPSGNVNYLTQAIDAIGGAGESALNEFLVELPLVTGTNVLGIEVHQVNGQSSDISFDASLSIMTPSEFIISTDSVLPVTLGAGAGYIARYVPTGECILPDTVFVNTTLTIDCSPYLAPGDVVVVPGITLTVDPGVEIWFPDEARLIVQGDLQVNGTSDQGVVFKENSGYGATSWGNLTFENTTGINYLNYLEIRNATTGIHPIHNRAAISGWFSEVVMDHVTLTDNFDNPIFCEWSDFTLTNSLIHSDVTGDLINIKYGDGYISDCTFIGNDQPDTDAIDYDRVEGGVIRNSVVESFFGFNSDAIDLGEECQDILIENCLLHDCTDKGISIGQSSTSTVKNTTIVNCNLGFGIKDLGEADIDHVTLYSNVIGVECYEKNPGLGGGFATITNSILSNSSMTPVSFDEISVFNSEYCFYDTDTMPGLTCTWMDPLFVDPTNYDFQLQSESPAVGAGNDDEDLGTLDHSYFSEPEIMFSDIQYFHLDTADQEFVKVLNSGIESMDLSNYTISEGINFVFPVGTIIAPGEKIMIVKDITLFPSATGQVFQWTSGQLENNGEMLILSDAYGIIVDHVWYDSDAPWPQIAMVDQYITLISSSLDNHFASSWMLSFPTVEISNLGETLISAYPNPAASMIDFVAPETISSVDVIDSSGRLLFSQRESSSVVRLNVQDLNPGLYLAVLNSKFKVKFMVER